MSAATSRIDASGADVVISIDAMGGDRGVAAVLKGMAMSLQKNPRLRYLLHGDAAVLDPGLRKDAALAARTEVRHAAGVVAMDDKPSRVLRSADGTSMWSALQAVKAGDRLFSLDDTTLRNRLEVARQSVAVADAELASASQMAFHDSASKAELAILTGRAQERRAELAAVQAQLARMEVTAPYDGIAVFADPDQWRGRPVATGERIMLLANPEKPGMLIHLPVSDAIALDQGAPVKHASRGYQGDGCTIFYAEYPTGTMTILALAEHLGGTSYVIYNQYDGWRWGGSIDADVQ